MADARVVGQNEPILGVKGEATFGVSLDSTGADSTAYRKLNMVQAPRPTFNLVRESRLLSGRGLMKNAADVYNSGKGGTVTTPFDMWATPKLLAQFLALVGQQHSEAGVGGSEVHTTSFDDSGMINEIGGTVTSSIPSTVNLAWDANGSGGAGEGITITGAMVSDLALALASGSNNNLMTMSGNFFSGFANEINGATEKERTYDGTWLTGSGLSDATYYSITDIATRTLDVEGNASQIMILKDFNLNISNGVNRIGSGDANGNAEFYAIPEYVVTGNMNIKWDDLFDLGSGNNVLQDFVDGDTLSLQLIWGAGLDALGEMQIDLELQYTGVGEDVSESGIFHALEFECLVNAALPGLKTQIFSGESEAAW